MTTRLAEGDRDWHASAVKTLTALFVTAVAVSVIHYADNYVNYGDFPQAADLPDPSRALVGTSWFLFTGAGIAGYLLFRRRPSSVALGLLAFYSGSGLVGIGHYAAEGAAEMPVARHAHIVADIVLGIAMLGFVLWALRRSRPREHRGPRRSAG